MNTYVTNYINKTSLKDYSKYLNPWNYTGDMLVHEITNGKLNYFALASVIKTASDYNPYFANNYFKNLLHNTTMSSLNLYNNLKDHIYHGKIQKRECKPKYRIKDIFNDHFDEASSLIEKVTTLP